MSQVLAVEDGACASHTEETVCSTGAPAAAHVALDAALASVAKVDKRRVSLHVCGEAAVGKSALVKAWLLGAVGTSSHTVGVDFGVKALPGLTAHIFDCSGAPEHRACVRHVLEDARALCWVATAAPEDTAAAVRKRALRLLREHFGLEPGVAGTVESAAGPISVFIVVMDGSHPARTCEDDGVQMVRIRHGDLQQAEAVLAALAQMLRR